MLTSGGFESGAAEQSRVPLSRQLPQQSQQTGLKNQAKFLPSRTWLKASTETLKRGGWWSERGDKMRGEERKRRRVKRGYETRPDRLACIEKGEGSLLGPIWSTAGEREGQNRGRDREKGRPPL